MQTRSKRHAHPHNSHTHARPRAREHAHAPSLCLSPPPLWSHLSLAELQLYLQLVPYCLLQLLLSISKLHLQHRQTFSTCSKDSNLQQATRL